MSAFASPREPLREYVEIKNVASINGVRRAMEFERERQIRLWESGGQLRARNP